MSSNNKILGLHNWDRPLLYCPLYDCPSFLYMHNIEIFRHEVFGEIRVTKDANELNKWLENKNVQYKVNGTWVPCAKYANQAWFEIKQEEMDNGRIVYHRKITGLGREGIIDLYKKAKIA